jgi:hypothetical protein
MKKLLFLLLSLPALAGNVGLVKDSSTNACSQTVNFTAASIKGAAAPLNNWTATTAPTVNEDSGDGYAVGSQWVDVTADKTYFCQDSSVGAAVWRELATSLYNPAAVAITGGTIDGATIGATTPAAATVTTAIATSTAANSIKTAGGVAFDGTGTNRGFRWLTSGSTRWIANLSGTETGSDAGASFNLLAYNDSGTLIDTPISVARASGGLLTLARPVSASGNLLVGLSVAPTPAARLCLKASTADASTDAQSWQDSTGAEIGALDSDGNLSLGGYLLPGTTSATVAGAIRYASGALEGYVGGSWVSLTAGAAGGEANTASNVGSAGVGLYKAKSSEDLQLYKILGSAGVSFALNGTDYADVKLDIASLTEDTTPEISADFVAVYDNSGTANKKVKLEKLATTGVYRTLWLDAAAMVPRTTNGCAARVTTESSTNKVMNDLLDFDKAADEFAQIRLVLPDEWDRSTIKAKIYWTAASSTGDVIWGVQGVALSNDDLLDTAFGTAVTVTDTLIATTDLHVTAATGAITIGGTPALADAVYLQIYRDADAGGDTLDADARLVGVSIQYKETTQAAGW